MGGLLEQEQTPMEVFFPGESESPQTKGQKTALGS